MRGFPTSPKSEGSISLHRITMAYSKFANWDDLVCSNDVAGLKVAMSSLHTKSYKLANLLSAIVILCNEID